MIYDEIIGQDKIKTYLRLSKEKHTLPHAILISGEEGSGKKRIDQTIKQIDGIKNVKFNKLIGSATIEYDHEILIEIGRASCRERV